VRGALGPHLNVFLVTQQQWSQSTVGLVTMLSGWLTLAMQTPIAAVAGAIGWRFSQRVVFLLASVFAVLAAAAAVPIIRLQAISIATAFRSSYAIGTAQGRALPHSGSLSPEHCR